MIPLECFVFGWRHFARFVACTSTKATASTNTAIANSQVLQTSFGASLNPPRPARKEEKKVSPKLLVNTAAGPKSLEGQFRVGDCRVIPGDRFQGLNRF